MAARLRCKTLCIFSVRLGMNVKNVGTVVRILSREIKQFPEPIVTQVSRRNSPFKVLIACVLSLRTKDTTTLPASNRLFALADTPEKMLTLSTKKIEKAIYPVSFYRVKTKNIKRICRLLLKNNSIVPDSIEELLKLPNVGRKTANIVITQAYKKQGIAVDVHVNRLSNRLGLVKTKTPDETEFALRKILPKRYWITWNDLLVTWGQNICRPVSPWCSRCKIRPHCDRIGVGRSR